MALFAQLRGRIGGAGLLLRSYPLGSALHQAQSEVQAAAVLSVLRSQGNQLTADEKARLSSMIAASAFAEKDALSRSHPDVPAPGRKKADDAHDVRCSHNGSNLWQAGARARWSVPEGLALHG